jgi:hypothetical protein
MKAIVEMLNREPSKRRRAPFTHHASRITHQRATEN